MTSATNATSRLGKFVARCRKEVFPPVVADKAAACLLDAIGLGILAHDERTSSAMRALLVPVRSGKMIARVWADGMPVAVSEAVTANAFAVHAQFHDDCLNVSAAHPGSLIVPVAVSLAEALDRCLDDVLRAIVAGYATLHFLGAGERVAKAMIYRGIRTSPTLGPIGAAAAAAVVLGLDEGRATNAVAMAASITGGLLEPVRAGSDEWRMQNAHAARGGLLAAQLAEKDVEGAPDALEGAKGLLRVMAGMNEPLPEWSVDPKIDAILEAWAKPWATLGDNVAAVAAAKLLHESGVNTARIRRITVRICRLHAEYPGTSFKGPYVRVTQAIASTLFATAAMLVYGHLEYEISLEHRNDARILRLVGLTTVEADDAYTEFDASVELELDDGSKLARTASDSPKVLLYHDRKTSSDLFEARLASGGMPAGTGRDVAGMIYDSMDRSQRISMRLLLDRIVQGCPR